MPDSNTAYWIHFSIYRQKKTRDRLICQDAIGRFEETKNIEKQEYEIISLDANIARIDDIVHEKNSGLDYKVVKIERTGSDNDFYWCKLQEEGFPMNTYNNNFYGPVHNVQIQQGGGKNIQKIEEDSIDYQEIIKAIEQINERISRIDKGLGEQDQLLRDHLDEILQLAQKHENPTKICQLLGVIRDLATGTSGSIIASWIEPLIPNLL